MEGVGDSPVATADPQSTPPTTPADSNQLHCLVCARCKAVVALADDIIAERIDIILKSDVFSYDLDIFDREVTSYSATNPNENRFDVLRLRIPSAEEHGHPLTPLHGEPTADHSWFPPYQWSFATCWRCDEHLGWGFRLPPVEPSSDSDSNDDDWSGCETGDGAKEGEGDEAVSAPASMEGGAAAPPPAGVGVTHCAPDGRDLSAAASALPADSSSAVVAPNQSRGGSGGGTGGTGGGGGGGADGPTGGVCGGGGDDDGGDDGEVQLLPTFLGLIVTKLRPDTITREEYLAAGAVPQAAALMQAMQAFNALLAAQQAAAGEGDDSDLDRDGDEGGADDDDDDSDSNGDGSVSVDADGQVDATALGELSMNEADEGDGSAGNGGDDDQHGDAGVGSYASDAPAER